VGQQVTQVHVAENRRDGEEPRFPAGRMKVVLDGLAVVMGLLVLPYEAGGERRVAPAAAPRVSGHTGEFSLEILPRHVIAQRKQASIGQGLAVV
jgi:hypothetical protein